MNTRLANIRIPKIDEMRRVVGERNTFFIKRGAQVTLFGFENKKKDKTKTGADLRELNSTQVDLA